MTYLAQKQSFCRPFTLFAFALGVAGLQICPQIPSAIFSLFLLTIGIFTAFRFPRLAVYTAAIVGFAYCSLFGNVYLADRIVLQKSGSTGMAVIKIIDLPKYEIDQWQFQGLILESDDYPELIGEKVKLSWYRTTQQIKPGDIWSFQLKLSIPNGVQNPGGFDSEMRALQQDWVGQGYIKNHAEYIGNTGSIDRFRNRLSGQIQIALPHGKARFVQALALGDTRQITDDDWEILRRTGITHLIAISGFHVGMVALFAVFCCGIAYKLFTSLGLIMPWPIASSWVSILSSCVYTALAGFAIPTVRTTLMIAVFMLAKILYRNISTIHAVALSMIAILLWDPFSILGAGFWLSFSGVLLLIAFMPLTNISGRIAVFMRAQWVVSLGLLPLCIGFFSQTTLIGPLVNMIAIPWISLVVVPLALFGVLLSWVPAVAAFFWLCAYQCMQWFWVLLEYLQHFKWVSFNIAEPSLLSVALAVIGVCLFLLPKNFPAKYLGLLLILPLLFKSHDEIPYQSIRIAVVDVGQGLSVLVRTKNHQLLYDTGAGNGNGFSRGTSTLIPALNALQITYLNKVIISHGDNDHYGGLQGLNENIEIGRIEASQMALDEPFFKCQQGITWQWDGVRFSYLWPNMHVSDKKNDRSCVLRIEADGRSILLTGDITDDSELSLVEQYGDKLQSDILLVPHHGSKTSSSIAFLNSVKPKIAIVSSGFQNRFKHPNKKVVERYLHVGVQVFNTVDMGWMELQSDATEWQWVHRERIDMQKFWHRPSHIESSVGY
ncbi:MAG TPA: DNA internalization-related competence protein ComEC/Rec2 [Arenimonas sp.]|nr:DNA internalization-related competence protein ComEC/Rec2 [Arenimonas sp.]